MPDIIIIPPGFGGAAYTRSLERMVHYKLDQPQFFDSEQNVSSSWRLVRQVPAGSNKVRTSLFTETWEKKLSSFEFWTFENVTQSGMRVQGLPLETAQEVVTILCTRVHTMTSVWHQYVISMTSVWHQYDISMSSVCHQYVISITLPYG